MQRETLVQREDIRPDILVMTATPIPQTLALTVYGDLDVSVIDQMPPGRSPVRTVHRPPEARERVFQFITEEVRRGRQAYVVYPLVEESERIDLAAATEQYYQLCRGVFSTIRTALLHGRIPRGEREATMEAFYQGRIDVIIGTTVIEVGIDVPNATVMLIEHAERFGLAQLHQLRGRVGRGPHPSYCILITDPAASDEAQRRVDAMCRTTDGFQIAEEDLRIRGPGDLLGTRQAGLPELRIADLTRDRELLEMARREAFKEMKDAHVV
jgi:ATP-dependent DNA helicase RecG